MHRREARPGEGCSGHPCAWQAAIPPSYLQNDGGSRLLIQDPSGAEQFKGRVGVVDELGVVVNQQGLDIVKDESKLVRPFHGVQARPVVRGQGGCQAGQGGGVHNLAHLKGPRARRSNTQQVMVGVTLPPSHPLLVLAGLQWATCLRKRAMKLFVFFFFFGREGHVLTSFIHSPTLSEHLLCARSGASSWAIRETVSVYQGDK